MSTLIVTESLDLLKYLYLANKHTCLTNDFFTVRRWFIWYAIFYKNYYKNYYLTIVLRFSVNLVFNFMII